jgi:hypothetical protein
MCLLSFLRQELKNGIVHYLSPDSNSFWSLFTVWAQEPKFHSHFECPVTSAVLWINKYMFVC